MCVSPLFLHVFLYILWGRGWVGGGWIGVMLNNHACHQKVAFWTHPRNPRIPRIVSLNPPSAPPFHTRWGSGWREFKTISLKWTWYLLRCWGVSGHMFVCVCWHHFGGHLGRLCTEALLGRLQRVDSRRPASYEMVQTCNLPITAHGSVCVCECVFVSLVFLLVRKFERKVPYAPCAPPGHP